MPKGHTLKYRRIQDINYKFINVKSSARSIHTASCHMTVYFFVKMWGIYSTFVINSKIENTLQYLGPTTRIVFIL